MQVAQYTTAKEEWNSIKVKHTGADLVQKARLQTLRSELETLKIKPNESANEFAGKLSSIQAKFKILGGTLKDKVLVRKLLNSVPKKFLPIVASIKQYQEIDTMQFEEAVGRITAFEERLKSQDEPENNYQNKLLLASSNNQGGGRGHGRNFTKNKRSYGKSTSRRSINKGFRGARKLKRGSLHLYVANGIRAEVKAIGSFDLHLPNGLIIVLDNCYYAPTITRGVVSVSKLVFKNEVENQLEKTIKALRSDRGGEYISQEFKDYIKACRIVQQLTPPYTPQHNGVSERRNRTLLNMVRSMMSLTTLPLSFWDYALETAARILNMVPTQKVDKTPYELWHVKVPNLSYLMVWGCKAHVKHHTAEKLEQRSVKCIFVGYPKETMGYYFYYPPENKVVVERYADFLKREFILQKESGRTIELDEEDTIPFENTSKHPIEAESLTPIIEEDVIPV
nr:zinc finger, CCHC-type [Tanacetum cinerariifolium]